MASNNHKIQNFIFDWSGVISDDFHFVFQTYLKIFAHYKKPPLSIGEFRLRFRLPYMDFCREYLGRTDERELGEIFKKFYTENNSMPAPIDGVEEVLKNLKMQEKVLVVLSSHSFVSLETKRFFPDRDYFDRIYEDIPNKEEAIENLMQDMGFQPDKTVYVGDMTHDIRAGKKAGLKTAAVLTGYQSKETLSKENPDYVLKDLKDIFHVIPI
ncbi:MAG: HAD family hydrolase [Candidatus Aureabacteria bacterium]|nr:HAD family hydrolase [Candidatus Auribacterota bacterium]